MFSSIHIRKFRSCRDVRLSDLQAILVLIGRNGAGKTNVLKAIQWVAHFVSGALEKPSALTRRSLSQDGDVSLTFEIDGSTYTYEFKRQSSIHIDEKAPPFRVSIEERVYTFADNVPHLIISRVGEKVTLTSLNGHESLDFEISESTSALLAIQALFPEKSVYRGLAADIQKFLSAVKYYPLHNFEEPAEEILIPGNTYEKWKSGKNRDLSNLSSLSYTLIQMSEERKDSFEELNSLMGPNGLGLIDEISVIAHTFPPSTADVIPESDRNTLYFVAFRFHESPDKHFAINDLSFGTVRILFLLVSMLFDQATVSLVEQPEDGVHIALVDKLVPLLRAYSKNSQFIVATHSIAVMNRAAASEIRFVTKQDGYTTVRPLSVAELQAAESYMQEDGPLSDFLESIGDAC